VYHPTRAAVLATLRKQPDDFGTADGHNIRVPARVNEQAGWCRQARPTFAAGVLVSVGAGAMEANLERHPGSLLLRISGDVRLWTDESAERELLTLFPDDIKIPERRLILSAGGITHIDTRGIAALVRIVMVCAKRNACMRTVLPRNNAAGEAIRRTRIFAAWPEFRSEEDALKELARGAAI
jgi:hypothetical protein